MRIGLPTITAIAVLVSCPALATDDSAKMEQSPGHQMKQDSAPGASEYAPGRKTENVQGQTPGHQMQEETGPGASQQAPGHEPKDASKY
jgi:hypothetical protein